MDARMTLPSESVPGETDEVHRLNMATNNALGAAAHYAFKDTPAGREAQYLLRRWKELASIPAFARASPDSVSPGTPERPTVKDLLNDYEKAVCILHEANLEAGEIDEDFDWDSATERYDAARSSIELYVAELQKELIALRSSP
jgi:hypothetical protein